MYTLFLGEPIATAILLIIIIGIVIKSAVIVKAGCIALLMGIAFFRVPEYKAPSDGRIYSPTYGTVTKISEMNGMTTLTVFLSPLDVHVQFAPTDGVLISQKYVPGKYNLAFDKDSEKNERLISVFATKYGPITLEQVAGFVVRRIVCWKKIGDHVTTGEPFGMIKFGSQVKITFPGKTDVVASTITPLVVLR